MITDLTWAYMKEIKTKLPFLYVSILRKIIPKHDFFWLENMVLIRHFKGIHLKASAQEHRRPLYAKEGFETEGHQGKSKGMEAIASMVFL